MDEKLRKSIVGMFLDGIITIGDVIDESYKYGRKTATNEACEWLDENAADYVEVVALTEDDTLTKFRHQDMIDDMKKHIEEK